MNIDESTKIFRVLAEGFDQNELLAAHNKTVELTNIGSTLMGKMQIPLLTNDENIKKYVKEFSLQKPEKLISFFIEANFAAFESIEESINELKLIDLENSISKVESAKRLVDFAIDNEKYKEKKLSSAQDLLFTAIEELKKKVESNIEGIRKIDNRSRWEFFLKSKVSLSAIDSYVYCAMYALESLMCAIQMHILIAGYLGVDIDSSVIAPFREFVEKEILGGDTCSLMYAYDKDQQNSYWLRFPKEYDKSIKKGNNLISYIDEYDDIEF